MNEFEGCYQYTHVHVRVKLLHVWKGLWYSIHVATLEYLATTYTDMGTSEWG